MIKLSVSEKGFAIFRDGVVLLSRGYSYSNKRDAILRNLQRGVLQCANYVAHINGCVLICLTKHTCKITLQLTWY